MYNQKMISFSKAFFIGLLIVGSTIANTSSDCVRDAAQTLSQEGQAKYSEISKESVVMTTVVANSGRRLQAIVPTAPSADEEDVFYEDGKKCAGQEVRTGKKYCKEYETLSDGSKVCKEYGELFEGSLCLVWGEEEVTSSVTTTENHTVSNPLFQEKLKESQTAEAAVIRQKDVVDKILVEKAAQTKITREKLTTAWEEVEKEWIRMNTQQMQDAKDNLTDKQKQELRELKEKYDKGVEEITTKWETEIASTKNKQTKEITDVLIEYEKQTVFLKEQHDAEVQKIMDAYKKETAELEAEFGEKFKKALEEWEAKWRNEQAADGDNKRTTELTALNEQYEKKIEEITTKYTTLWTEHHKGVQNAPVDIEDLNNKILQIKEEYMTWVTNFNNTATNQTKDAARKCRDEYEVTKIRITKQFNKMMDDIEKKHTVYNYEVITTTGQKAAICQAKLNSQFEIYRNDWELRRKQEIGRLNAEWEKVKATTSKAELTQTPISLARAAVRVRSTYSGKCGRKLCGCHHGHSSNGSRRLCWYSPRVITPQVKSTLRPVVSSSQTPVKCTCQRAPRTSTTSSVKQSNCTCGQNNGKCTCTKGKCTCNRGNCGTTSTPKPSSTVIYCRKPAAATPKPVAATPKPAVAPPKPAVAPTNNVIYCVKPKPATVTPKPALTVTTKPLLITKPAATPKPTLNVIKPYCGKPPATPKPTPATPATPQ